MADDIKVTFFMMAYNTEAFIEKSIRSVLNQTEKDIVLCIRNNGSSDRTGEIIEKLAAEDSRIYYVENEVNGKTDDGIVPFEIGWWPVIPNQKSEYVSIIDSDDYLEPDFVSTLYKQAKENRAEITAAGNYFVDETGKYLGARTPPDYNLDKMSDMSSEGFTRVYNCFRTWWGKLYEWDFFWYNYAFAWKAVYPVQWSIDTTVMIKYLDICKKLVTVDKPLYNMTLRTKSTYKLRPFDKYRIYEAKAIYDTNISFLNKHGMNNEENMESIETFYFTYLCESAEILRKGEVPLESKLNALNMIFSDETVAEHIENRFQLMCGIFMNFLNEILTSNKDEKELFSSFVMRFIETINNMDNSGAGNILNNVILYGVVADKNNSLNFGSKMLLSKTFSISKGVRSCFEQGENILNERYYDPAVFIDKVNNIDRNSRVELLEEKLINEWENENYEVVCDLISEITLLCPFNDIALYFRIQIALLIDDMEFALLLYYTALSIWPDDEKFLAL